MANYSPRVLPIREQKPQPHNGKKIVTATQRVKYDTVDSSAMIGESGAFSWFSVELASSRVASGVDVLVELFSEEGFDSWCSTGILRLIQTL